jgi:site-specific recombinase XerD
MKTSQRLEQGLQQMQGWMVLRHNRSKTFHQYARIVRAFYVWLQAHPENGQLSSEKKIETWLTARARQGCAASTQNVEFSALRLFYERGLGVQLHGIDALRAVRPPTIRRAPSLEQVAAILPLVPNLYGYPCQLIVEWIYGSGLRVSEPLNARLKDIDWKESKFTVRDGKHGVSRVVPIPCCLMPRLAAQAEIARLVHLQDKANGVPVPLPRLLAKKYPRAPFAEAWAFLFPAKAPCEYEGGTWRYRVHEAAVQRAFKAGVLAAGVAEDLTPHHLRHAWATHMARRTGVTLRDVQVALGHKHLDTTAGYVTPEVDRLPDALECLRRSNIVPLVMHRA